MLKESILFVASTGVLIYLIAPSNEPPEAEPAVQTEPAAVKAPVTPDHGWDSVGSGDDGWGDEEEEDSENFTFGDPTTVLDGDGDNDNGDEEQSSSRTQPAAPSPGSAQPGSIYNPITVAPRNLPNPNAR